MFKKIIEKIKKYKVKAKKLYTIIALTIIEMIAIVWWNSWIITPAILAPLIQFVAIFEHRDVWAKLSEEEKKEITLSEEDLDNFVKGVVRTIIDGKNIEDILKKIKEE